MYIHIYIYIFFLVSGQTKIPNSEGEATQCAGMSTPGGISS